MKKITFLIAFLLISLTSFSQESAKAKALLDEVARKIEGYKNLDIELIHNSDIIAFIGNNGSGKSNLLEALSLIFKSLYNSWLRKKSLNSCIVLIKQKSNQEKPFDRQTSLSSDPVTYRL